MDFLLDLPVWMVAILIFLIRIVDVTVGTLRTISLVQGRILLSVFLGFIEVVVWTIAITQVIGGVSQSPLLLCAYAGGFSVGNAVGILIDRKIALGYAVVRMISSLHGKAIATKLRAEGFRATTFVGEIEEGPVVLVYATCPRRRLNKLLKLSREIEPNIFYTVEPVHQHSDPYTGTLPPPTGWRAVLKKK